MIIFQFTETRKFEHHLLYLLENNRHINKISIIEKKMKRTLLIAYKILTNVLFIRVIIDRYLHQLFLIKISKKIIYKKLLTDTSYNEFIGCIMQQLPLNTCNRRINRNIRDFIYCNSSSLIHEVTGIYQMIFLSPEILIN